MPDLIAYKLLPAAAWQAMGELGLFAGSPVDIADGFIHLSTAAQLTETADKHFAGQDGLMVLAIDLPGLGAALRWEPSRGGQLFPHLYASLPLDKVLGACPLSRDGAGRVRLPRL